MKDLTERELNWFHVANAGNYFEKRSEFYPFKSRFLKRYGTPDGWDSQEIPRECFTCDGSGQYSKEQKCFRCDGTGVHHTSFTWLARYDLGGRIYHIPEPPPFVQPVKNEIEGYITHEPVDGKTARRCFQRLLLRVEPVSFYWYIIRAVRGHCGAIRAAVAWKLIRLRNKMDLFPAVNDDVPF